MNLTQQLSGFRPLYDQPVGMGALYAIGFGLSRGLGNVLGSLVGVPATYVPVVLAMLVKMNPVQGFIGGDLAELIATVSWIDTVDRTLGISATVTNTISSLAPAAPAPAPVEQGWWSSLFSSGAVPRRANQPILPAPMPGRTRLEAKLAAIA